MSVRRALLLASGERYAVIILNVAMTVIVVRLLTPADFGISVLGLGFVAIADSLREFGTSSYLVQKNQLTGDDVRTAFSIMMLLTIALAAALFLLSGPFSRLYATPGLEAYLKLISATFLLGPFTATVTALLRRGMAFRELALMGAAHAFVYSLLTVALAALGFQYMSFAWAGLAAGVVALAIGITYQPCLPCFRPSLKNWRAAARYAGYDSSTIFLNRAWEMLPYFVFGRILGMDAVGLFKQATAVCQLPERLLFAGIGPVALPVLSERARMGHSLKEPYLQALSFITVVHWPAVMVLALLAHPIVLILLGTQWLGVVPLVQTMAFAYALFFPAPMTYPTLVAAGAVRDTMTASLIALPISAVILSLAAFGGLQAIAIGMLFAMPFQVAVVVFFIRRRVGFYWREFFGALGKSAVVCAVTALGPLIVLGSNGFDLRLSPSAAAVAAGLSLIGWGAGIWLCQHPILRELEKFGAAIDRRSAPG